MLKDAINTKTDPKATLIESLAGKIGFYANYIYSDYIGGNPDFLSKRLFNFIKKRDYKRNECWTLQPETIEGLRNLAQNQPEPLTVYDDSKSFQHDNSNLDIVDSMPPVSYIKGFNFLNTKVAYVSDDKYQDLYDSRLDNYKDQVSYGEGFMGVADHVSDMTHLDRMIFEDCFDGSNSVQRPSLNVPQVSSNTMVERLATSLNITLDQAEDLIDFWSIIDDSQRTWNEFKRWVKAKGIEKALPYFKTLAGQLVDDNCSTEPIAFDLIDDIGYQETRLTIAEAETQPDLNLDMVEQNLNRQRFKTEKKPVFFWNVDSANKGFTVIPSVINPNSQLVHDKGFSTPKEYKYVIINNEPIEATHPKPEVFDKIISLINSGNLATVNKIRKNAGSKEKSPIAWMSGAQKHLFWETSKKRQAVLEGFKEQYIQSLLDSIGKVEKVSLSQMRNCKSSAQAGYYWHLIYEAQKGNKNLGRFNFVEYILKPELNKRKQYLIKFEKEHPEQQDNASDAWEGLLESVEKLRN